MKLRYIFIALFCLCLLITPASAAGGSGTAASPYIIETAAELQSIQNNLGAYYQLANDIDLSGVSWTPIGSSRAPFTGSLNGNGHTIKNLVLSTSTQTFTQTGFFSVLSSGAIIKDVTFRDCSVSSTSSNCGVVVGQIAMSTFMHNTALLSNVDLVRCTLNCGNYNSACIIGMVNSYAVVNIIDCDVQNCIAESTSSGYVGVITGGTNGRSSIEITGCTVSDSIIRGKDGYISCFVVECSAASSYVITDCDVQNCIAESTSNGYVGGFVGVCSGSSSTVNINNSEIINCLVKGTNYIGGIVGRSEGEGNTMIQNCDVTDCSIVATTKYAGGITGICTNGASGTFSGCSVTDSTIIASRYAATICPEFS